MNGELKYDEGGFLPRGVRLVQNKGKYPIKMTPNGVKRVAEEGVQDE